MIRKLPRLAMLATLSMCLFASSAARAQEESEGAAMAANRGLKIGLGPILVLPMRTNGPFGGGLDLEARYGIKAGPMVVAPGGLVSGYLISSRAVATAMPTLRITLPIGPLAPYGIGGIGGGWLSNPNEGGLAYLGGGGLMIHFGRILAIGAEITYRRITGTELGGLTFGPSISIGG